MSKEPRPLAAGVKAAAELVDLIGAGCERIAVAGSIRRAKTEVGDIELVAIPRVNEVPDGLFGTKLVNAFWPVVDACQRLVKAKGAEKYRQYTYTARDDASFQVDVFTATAETFGWTLLVRTGSAEFSHSVASMLNANGYTSRDGGICRMGDGGHIPTPEEVDVFALIGRPFVAPKDRYGWIR